MFIRLGRTNLKLRAWYLLLFFVYRTYHVSKQFVTSSSIVSEEEVIHAVAVRKHNKIALINRQIQYYIQYTKKHIITCSILVLQRNNVGPYVNSSIIIHYITCHFADCVLLSKTTCIIHAFRFLFVS